MQGNAVKHALGESISFGRFMSDDQSLSWEKWSTFSHKKYVEEAERYAKPGSVAQKKAFFEAHYKKIRSAEQSKESEAVDHVKIEGEVNIHDTKQDDHVLNNVHNNNERSSIAVVVIENGKIGEKNEASCESPAKRNSSDRLVHDENNVNRSTRRSCLDPVDKKRSSSKSLRALLNLVTVTETDRETIPSTDCSTFTASTKGGVSSSYTLSENTRTKIPNDSSAPRRSKTRSKWHILSALCCSKSFRTEEIATKSKQEKTGNEFRKLICGFCFKSQPLLDSYKDEETPKNQIEKFHDVIETSEDVCLVQSFGLSVMQTSTIQSRSVELERSNLNKMNGSTSVPPPPPPPTFSVKNSPSKNLSKK